MEEFDNRDPKDEVFSKVIRAGKRTYFFDVKATKSGEYYITITESKRRFDNDQGKFIYEKHKLFLYKEDFEKFATGLNQTIQFCETGELPIEADLVETIEPGLTSEITDFDFEIK
jgi:hypothetical protein